MSPSLPALKLCAALLATSALAGDDENVVHCDNCADWNQPQAPFNIYGNTWYVGTSGLSSILITSPTGHVLIDGDLPQSAAQVQANIEALGFRIGDVKLILNSHAHFDHAGGIAALQRASGATVAASPAAARVLRKGTVGADDPQFVTSTPFHVPKVSKVSEVADGQTLRVGGIAVTAHATPGHTPGGTTWTWTSCEAGKCLHVVYADSLTPVSLGNFRYSGGNGRPDISKSFAASIAKVAALSCDIVLSVHPGVTDTMDKQAAKTAAKNPFVDPEGCRNYAAAATEKLNARLAEEARSEAR
jgi:metallo-beta-lactamase class B